MMWYVIAFVIALCVICGVTVYDFKVHKYKKEQLHGKLSDFKGLSDTFEVDRLKIEYDLERNEKKFEDNVVRDFMLFICFSIFFVCSLLGFRDACMYDITVGKYNVEKVVITKTRGTTVQIDTTYHFYKNQE